MTAPRFTAIRATIAVLLTAALVIGPAGIAAADDGNTAVGAVQTQPGGPDSAEGGVVSDNTAEPDADEVAAAKKAAKAAAKKAKEAAKKAALKLAKTQARAAATKARAAAKQARADGKAARAAGARLAARSGDAAVRAAEAAKKRASRISELIRSGASAKKLAKAADNATAATKTANAAAKTARKHLAKVDARLATCSPQARACVDLTTDMAWLQSRGKIVYGPVPITAGRQGHLTRPGTWRVYYKNKDHKSREFNLAPMPYSVFFDSVGIAFHVGSLTVASHGCIHLSWAAGVKFFDFLRYGDQVHVFGKTPYARGQIYV